MKAIELKKLVAAKCIVTINNITFRGTIREVYSDKINVNGKFFSMKNVTYGTNELPKNNCVSVPLRDKRGYTSNESNEIMQNLPHLTK